ncbi:MAG: FAD-dependent oxidoreductase [Candidatus Humimicrobiaceae bacterium]
MTNKNHFDIIIIGAGVIGVSLAMKLSYYDIKVLVLEKNSYVCSVQSKGNGALGHAGHNEPPGSLKAKLCVEGNKLYPELLNLLGIKYRQPGYLNVAFNDEEMEIIKEREAKSKLNNVRTKILTKDELKKLEPNVSDKAISALWIMDSLYFDIQKFVIASAEFAVVNGVKFVFNSEVLGLIINNDRIEGVKTKENNYFSKIIINCAGIYSDEIMQMAGINDFKITPWKGEFIVYDKAEGKLVNRPIYRVPTPTGKGVVICQTIHGNLMVGGNSFQIDSKNDTSTTKNAFDFIMRNGSEMIPKIKGKKMITSFAGIRAKGSTGDFYIRLADKPKGLINVSGIDSPGIASAPAIANYIVEQIKENYSDLNKKAELKLYSLPSLFRDLNLREKKKLLKKDSRFGKIVCRCENITEGDIVRCLEAPIPAKTIDAIKFRANVGYGRCSGAFDISRVLDIITKFNQIDPYEVLKNDSGSNILINNYE